MKKTVLILGANSDVAKEAIKKYIEKGYFVYAASRNTTELKEFAEENKYNKTQFDERYFDALAFESHQAFYHSLIHKPAIVLYAAGFLVTNEEAFEDFESAFTMMKTNYCGAVSILNIVMEDKDNTSLERIMGMSSLSGVRGRKSNFIYGSTKAAFTQYLAGMRQHLAERKVVVNAFIIGYVNTKINEGLELNQSLIMEPDFVAGKIVNCNSSFIQVPGWKWKKIHQILKILPEWAVAKLP